MITLKKRPRIQLKLLIIFILLYHIIACDQSNKLNSGPIKIILSQGKNYTGNVVWDPDDAFKEINAIEYHAEISEIEELGKFKSIIVVDSDKNLSVHLDTNNVRIPKVEFGKESVILIRSADACAKAELIHLVIHNKKPIVYNIKNSYIAGNGKAICSEGAVALFIAFVVVPNEYL